MTKEPGKPVHSPICYSAEADDVYMGFAGTDELIAALDDLLRVEQIGAHIAGAGTKDGGGDAHTALMNAVLGNEREWYATLAGHIVRLGSVPASEAEAGPEKAMPILDQLAALHRIHADLVGRLQALLPRVRDDVLHADLRKILEGHRLQGLGLDALLDRNGL